MADPEIWPDGGPFNMFPSISRFVYFFVGGGPKSIAKLDGGHGWIFPLDTQLLGDQVDPQTRVGGKRQQTEVCTLSHKNIFELDPVEFF